MLCGWRQAWYELPVLPLVTPGSQPPSHMLLSELRRPEPSGDQHWPDSSVRAVVLTAEEYNGGATPPHTPQDGAASSSRSSSEFSLRVWCCAEAVLRAKQPGHCQSRNGEKSGIHSCRPISRSTFATHAKEMWYGQQPSPRGFTCSMASRRHFITVRSGVSAKFETRHLDDLREVVDRRLTENPFNLDNFQKVLFAAWPLDSDDADWPRSPCGGRPMGEGGCGGCGGRPHLVHSCEVRPSV